MAAALGLQPGRDEGPGRTEQTAGNDGEQQQQGERQDVAEQQADQADAEAADIGLPSPPMLNRPAWKATATARPVKMKPVA